MSSCDLAPITITTATKNDWGGNSNNFNVVVKIL